MGRLSLLKPKREQQVKYLLSCLEVNDGDILVVESSDAQNALENRLPQQPENWKTDGVTLATMRDKNFLAFKRASSRMEKLHFANKFTKSLLKK